MTRREYLTIFPKPEEYAYWRDAVVTGKGGYQGLARKIQAGLRLEDLSLTMARDDFFRVCQYSAREDGGYQSHLRKLVVAWLLDNFEDVV